MSEPALYTMTLYHPLEAGTPITTITTAGFSCFCLTDEPVPLTRTKKSPVSVNNCSGRLELGYKWQGLQWLPASWQGHGSWWVKKRTSVRGEAGRLLGLPPIG